jgi:hypothetical protein
MSWTKIADVNNYIEWQNTIEGTLYSITITDCIKIYKVLPNELGLWRKLYKSDRGETSNEIVSLIKNDIESFLMEESL